VITGATEGVTDAACGALFGALFGASAECVSAGSVVGDLRRSSAAPPAAKSATAPSSNGTALRDDFGGAGVALMPLMFGVVAGIRAVACTAAGVGAG
jgi:hypothetical protein